MKADHEIVPENGDYAHTECTVCGVRVTRYSGMGYVHDDPPRPVGSPVVRPRGKTWSSYHPRGSRR